MVFFHPNVLTIIISVLAGAATYKFVIDKEKHKLAALVNHVDVVGKYLVMKDVLTSKQLDKILNASYRSQKVNALLHELPLTDASCAHFAEALHISKNEEAYYYLEKKIQERHAEIEKSQTSVVCGKGVTQQVGM